MLNKLIISILLVANIPVFTFAGSELSADTSLQYIAEVNINGNHKTHEKIILRELDLELNKAYSARELDLRLEKSKENLVNTSLFNFVTLNYNQGIVNIELVERWYIWPFPIFEHADRNLPAWIRDPDLKKLNYGVQVNWNNFRGLNEILEAKLRLGYKEQFSLIYSKPNIDREQKHGITVGYNLFRQHEVTFRSEGNKPQYLEMQDDYLQEALAVGVGYFYRPGIYFHSGISLGYNETLFRNTDFHREYLGIDPGQILNWFSIQLSASLEHRDKVAYPLDGYHLKMKFLQTGLGIIADFPNRRSQLSLSGSVQKSLSKRWYLQNASKIRLAANQDLPYYFREGIGYATYMRGFEYYLIDGNSYFLSVNNLKFNLIPQSEYEFNWIPWEQFSKIHYALFTKLFFDVSYVQSPYYEGITDDLSNKLLFSTGLGFDLVSYYDQVIRVECTLNSTGHWGVFLHTETVFSRW